MSRDPDDDNKPSFLLGFGSPNPKATMTRYVHEIAAAHDLSHEVQAALLGVHRLDELQDGRVVCRTEPRCRVRREHESVRARKRRARVHGDEQQR